MGSSFFMGSMGGGLSDEPAYLLQPRRRSHSRLSLLTLGLTSGVAVAVTALVCAVYFMQDAGAMLEMQKRYGPPQCPEPGHKSFSEPVVNFSPCCLHYPATCCATPCLQQEAGEAAFCHAIHRMNVNTGLGMVLEDSHTTGSRIDDVRNGGGYTGIRKLVGLILGSADMATHFVGDRRLGARIDGTNFAGRNAHSGGGDCTGLLKDRCAEKRNLLACARCSPFAGHFEKPVAHNITLTICDGFCRELWTACRPDQEQADDDGYLLFCSGLGVEVAPPGDQAQCFSASPRSVTGPRTWQAGLALLVAEWGRRMVVGGRGHRNLRERRR